MKKLLALMLALVMSLSLAACDSGPDKQPAIDAYNQCSETYNKFVDIMRQKGVVAIEALGADFDPDLHEAVARFAAGEEKSGKVIDVVQQGYKQGEQVLRYAKVVVGE